MPAPWMASTDSIHRQDQSAHGAVLLKRFDTVRRAGRLIAARPTDVRRDHQLVPAHQQDQYFSRKRVKESKHGGGVHFLQCYASPNRLFTRTSTSMKTPLSENAVLEILSVVRYGSDGLVPVIAQDADSLEVLMLAYMNEATLRQTLETRRMTYWSRSRGEVWVKGGTRGHDQDVVDARVDCDGDTLLFRDLQHDAACHAVECAIYYIPWPAEGAR